MDIWDEKTVLVTGACGTVGKQLIHDLTRSTAARIVAFDNSETELFYLAEEFRSNPKVSVSLGDIRDGARLRSEFAGVDVILHCAAFKHVVLCERDPMEATKTNIVGTQNVIEAAKANGVERVLYTSTDKAVNPSSVMGVSKLMGERLITAAAIRSGSNGTIFASTRFGNVLGSRGSVIPLFLRQVRAAGPVTITHPGMSRFIMTIEDASRLVLNSLELARGGEVFITKMPAVTITDLAEVVIDAIAPLAGIDSSKIERRVIGMKPGEKLQEELMTEEETRRAIELEDHFVVLPSVPNAEPIRAHGTVRGKPVGRAYSSATQPAMTRAQLRDYLVQARVLEG